MKCSWFFLFRVNFCGFWKSHVPTCYFDFTWPQKLMNLTSRCYIFNNVSNPEDRREESISGLIFNIHNRSALDFIRLWSGLYHQLYAAYHMHIKCREPAVLESARTSDRLRLFELIKKLILLMRSKVIGWPHNNHSKHWLRVVLVQLGGCLNQLRLYLWLFFIWKFTEYNLHINKSIHLYNLYYTHIKNNVGWKEKIDF